MRILAATDFSEEARKAAGRAAALAREHGAHAELVHVLPELPLEAELRLRATGALERALESLAGEFGLAARFASGPVSEALTAAAREFDLVVVGARGLHPLRDFALGTTAERLVRRSPVPVLVVKRPAAGPYRQALAPTDFSSDARAALAFAARLAPQATLHVLHAYEPPFEGTLRLASVPQAQIEQHRSEVRDAAHAAMEAMLAELGLPATRIRRSLEAGYPPERMTQAAERLGADLVVLGKHGKGLVEELLVGSVTLHALSRAQCDVLVVPPPKGP